jgi:hypothetical protein
MLQKTMTVHRILVAVVVECYIEDEPEMQRE